jgi:hypothetical protein
VRSVATSLRSSVGAASLPCRLLTKKNIADRVQ